MGFPRLFEIVRFYAAGAVNAGFGFGLYALLVWIGLDRYPAQLVAHVTGVAFNYLTYSRHVFRDSGPAKLRFAASYTVNYFISLAMLAAASAFIASPYLAGLASILATSIINYFMLRYLVFNKADPKDQ
jgi:putative flippase GtrA